MAYKLVTLGGDGTGPEVMREGMRVLNAALASMANESADALQGRSIVEFCQTAEDRSRVVEVLAGYSAPGPTIYGLTTKGRASSPNVRAVMRFLADAFAA